MKPMLPTSTSWFSRTLAIALLLVPAAAEAQSLPKGYASDESPNAPPAAVATTQTTTPAPAMKATTGEDEAASGTATTQISTAADDYADTDASALTDFQEPLQGYGSWVNDDTYGTVWVPDSAQVGSDFAPYQTGGYWSLNDDGDWLWESTYDWGYVPFHYGRWIWIAGRGWSWIPGRTYAPSWVVWRTSDYGYLGWAPMPPSWYWYGGSAVYFTTVPAAAYVFCPTSYVFHSSVSNYVVHDKDTVGRIAAHSRSYKPASPTTGSSSDHKAADNVTASGSTHSSASASASSAAAGGARAVQKPVGPSMKEAGVPDSAVPAKRSTVDSRAALFAKKSTTAKAKALVKSTRTAAMGSAGNMPVSRAGTMVGRSTFSGTAASRTLGVSSTPSASRSSPVIRTPSAGSASASSRVSSPVYAPSRASTPVYTPSRVSTPVYSPSRAAAPVYAPSRASAPVYAPSRSYSPAPVSRPSFSAPRMSAPVSAPRVSTPHFSGGGGGMRGGGGHRR